MKDKLFNLIKESQFLQLFEDSARKTKVNQPQSIARVERFDSETSEFIVKTPQGQLVRTASITNRFLSKGSIVELTYGGSPRGFIDARVKG